MESNMLFRRIVATVLTTVLCGSAFAATAFAAGNLLWIEQFGTAASDFAVAISQDGLGSNYVAGHTLGEIGGPNAGELDVYLSRYDADGNLNWSRQLGTDATDEVSGVSADALGNIYISGSTWGSFDAPNLGFRDAFVSKYDSAGILEWTRQLGTEWHDSASSVSTDGLGNVYITGSTLGNFVEPNAEYTGFDDAFVSKFDTAGNRLWIRQLGTERSDEARAISADGLGNAYVTGHTNGFLDGIDDGHSNDAFLTKYDYAGSLQWTRQLATALGESATGLAVSADGLGSIYISGNTQGSLGGPNAGDVDAFVSKYNDGGDLKWTRQLGASLHDAASGVSADGLGNVYITGYTENGLDGPNLGDFDAFVSKYKDSGDLQWTRQLGTAEEDRALGVTADGQGNIFISGYTEGNLGGPTAGSWEAFVAKYIDAPDPPTGDYNRDFVVNVADYTIWRDTVGNLVEPCSGADANCNGFVENAEYGVWKDHFGDSSGVGSDQTARIVPEPATIRLMLSILCGLVLVRRR